MRQSVRALTECDMTKAASVALLGSALVGLMGLPVLGLAQSGLDIPRPPAPVGSPTTTATPAVPPGSKTSPLASRAKPATVVTTPRKPATTTTTTTATIAKPPVEKGLAEKPAA